mgnify:CR=1 FL=1
MKKFQQCPWSIGTENFEVEFAIFLEHLREYERFCQLEEAQNAFLDAYSAWRNHPRDRAMKAHLIWCTAYLSSLDPTFQGPKTLRRYYTVSQE